MVQELSPRGGRMGEAAKIVTSHYPVDFISKLTNGWDD